MDEQQMYSAILICRQGIKNAKSSIVVNIPKKLFSLTVSYPVLYTAGNTQPSVTKIK